MDNKKIRFALVGCGRIAGKHIEALNNIKDAVLIALCDTNKDRAKAAAKKAGNIPYYLSYDEMLQKEEVLSFLWDMKLQAPQQSDPYHLLKSVLTTKEWIII